MRKLQIMQGELLFPEQILKIINPTNTKSITNLINEFWDNVWHNYLKEKSCNTIIWYQRFENEQQGLFNLMLLHLSKSGWISSTVEANYAYIMLNEQKLLKWVNKDTLYTTKLRYKFNKYRLKETKSTLFNIVQINNTHKVTGLERKGFMKAGNNKFTYDKEYLNKYATCIAQNIKKGLTASTKDITYQEIIDELLNYYGINEESYTLGNCLIDSRGRSIFQCSKKIFNPVSHKDARALLILPIKEQKQLTLNGINYIYAAIAELLGYRGSNFEDKIKFGEKAYQDNILPVLEEMVLKQNFDDLHILIWLERIYENLNNYNNPKSKHYNTWSVPIEIDAMASQIQLIAVLTNDKTYMERTNLIGETFEDIWSLPYISRKHVKKVMTPKLYGSGKHPKELWDKNKLSYNQVQLNQISEEIETGIFANANNFKDFIINNVQPDVEMKIKIFNEEFFIECNRFKQEIITKSEFYIFTSQQNKMKKVVKERCNVPDLNQFKRFAVTLLLHNLDSQIANSICKQIHWVLPNHDSFVAHPNNILDIQESYITEMRIIYNNRKIILKDYFKSIGITQDYPIKDNEFYVKEFSIHCLK